jgi:hypothetical protein
LNTDGTLERLKYSVDILGGDSADDQWKVRQQMRQLWFEMCVLCCGVQEAIGYIWNVN